MPLPCHACIAKVVTSIGFEVASFRSDQVATPQLLKPFGQIEVSGRILQIKDLIGRPRLSLDLLQRAHRSGIGLVPERIHLRLVSSNMFEIGDRMRVCLKALPLPLIAHGLKNSAQPPSRPGGLRRSNHSNPLAYGKNRKLRSQFRQSLFKRLHTIPDPEGPVVTELIIGYRSRTPKDITSAMRDSGLAHCLAIFGLHISLVTCIVFAVVP